MVFSEFFDKTQTKQNSAGRSEETNQEVDGSQQATVKKQRNKRKKRIKKGVDGKSENSQSSASLGKRKAPSRDEPSTKKTRPSKKKPSKPSNDALRLSDKLKELSRQKNLDDALKVYWDKSNDLIRDGHHSCIIVDCCARCGNISEGDKIVEHMNESGLHVNVETKTALLKGYAHSGQIAKGEALFESMCSAQSKNDRPNVRTLNTLLRGCLWSAATTDKHGVVYGGVVTAEKAWNLYKNLQETDSGSVIFDVSSYEYSISLLCQALRTEEGKGRISEMQVSFNVTDDLTNASQSVTESLAIAYLTLARAYATLNQRDEAISACHRSLDFVKASKRSLKTGTDASSQHGKRAWKKGNDGSDRRAESNVIFRDHRLTEVEVEAKAIIEIVRNADASPSPRQLARRLLTRLIVLSGGGTTDVENHISKGKETESKNGKGEFSKATQSQLFNTVYFSHGLEAVLKKMDIPLVQGHNKVLRRRDCNRVLGCVGLQGGIVGAEGAIDFHKIFAAGIGESKTRKMHNKKPRPLEIELGAGFGDWIVKKAMDNPSTDFLSVELRADRVGQTFARTAIMGGCTPVDNLCIVGAESRSFLLDHVQNESVSTIYINHPEPPTQTFGAETANLQPIMDGEVEPAHMVSSRTIVAAAKCLSKTWESRLVIVTDNRWYGRLICATLVKVNRENRGLLYPVDLAKINSGFKIIESFDTDGNDRVDLFEGQPDETIGHAKTNLKKSAGVSYFDRLWRSGAGTHAERSARFIIVMARSKEL